MVPVGAMPVVRLGGPRDSTDTDEAAAMREEKKYSSVPCGLVTNTFLW